MWRLEFDAIRAEGGCFVLTNHPFLSGRPSRAQALSGLIEYVCAQDDVWVASLGEIATHVRGLGLTPRSVERPDPADF
jgi:peptidoglycan/xylan/chitin deacetylase (PgdA/CDA1 family)